MPLLYTTLIISQNFFDSQAGIVVAVEEVSKESTTAKAVDVEEDVAGVAKNAIFAIAAGEREGLATSISIDTG